MQVTCDNPAAANSSPNSNLSPQAYHLISPQVSGLSMPLQCTLTNIPVVQQASVRNGSSAEQQNCLATTTTSNSHTTSFGQQPIYNQIYRTLQTYQQPMPTQQQQQQYFSPSTSSPSYIGDGYNRTLPAVIQSTGSALTQPPMHSTLTSPFNSPVVGGLVTVERSQQPHQHQYGRPTSLTLGSYNHARLQNSAHNSATVLQQQPRMNSLAQKSINSKFAALNSPSQLERMIEKSSTSNSTLPVLFTQPTSDMLREEVAPNNDDSLSTIARVVDQANRLQHWHHHVHQPQQQQQEQKLQQLHLYHQQHRLQPQQIQVQLSPDRVCNEISLCSNNDMSASTLKTNVDSHRTKLVESSSSSSAISSSSAPTAASASQGSVTATASVSSAKLTSSEAPKEVDGKFKSYLAHLVLASNVPFAYAIILVAFLITVIAATSIITILTIILTITGYTAYPLTENTFNTSLVIGVVCASFALALVTASLVVWRRHCQAAYYYLDDPQSASRGTNSPQLSETYDDTEYGSIPVQDWAKHVQKLHADGDIGFSREFGQIQSSKSANLTCENSRNPENKHKNRYINIVAYDHTRVMLRQLPNQKKLGSDYINANFIDVSIDIYINNGEKTGS